MKLCLALSVQAIGLIIYNVFFHPLSKYPGPILAAATPIPFAYRVFNGRGVDWLQYLHERYGKVVRVRPNELSYADSRAWPDIFSNRPLLPKPSWRLFKVPGLLPNMNEVVSHAEHNRMRKILAPGFSVGALRKQEYIVQNYITLLVKHIQERVKHADNEFAEVELHQIFQFTTFDIIGDLLFGESFHSLENSEHHPWVKTIFKGAKFSMQLSAIQYLGPLDYLVKWILPKAVIRLAAEHHNWSREKVDSRMFQGSGREDVMSYILRENSDEDKAVTREAVDSNAALFIMAGSETVAVAATSATWFLLKTPLAFKRLQQEIRTSFNSGEEITMAKTASLPYLHAAIFEALRLHPPQALATPGRVVDRPNVVVCGQVVPIGVSTLLPAFPLRPVSPVIFNETEEKLTPFLSSS